MQQDGWIGGGLVTVARLGLNCAKKIADIHEDAGDAKGQPPAERAMDEHNNAVGRRVGKGGGDCVKNCDAELKNGNLQTAP